MERLAINIESIDVLSVISDQEMMIKTLNNQPLEYDVVLDRLGSFLNNANTPDCALDNLSL